MQISWLDKIAAQNTMLTFTSTAMSNFLFQKIFISKTNAELTIIHKYFLVVSF